MNGEYRENAEWFLKRNRLYATQTLKFYPEVENLEFNSLEELVEKVLLLTHTHSSESMVFKKIETLPDRSRSVLDIWRHVKYYSPDTDIFDVMHTLYSLKKVLVGHYCCNVRRRVFQHKSVGPGGWKLITSDRDEFGLFFDDWENI